VASGGLVRILTEASMTREEERYQILEELREMSERIAASGSQVTAEEMDRYFAKAEQIPLADRSLEAAAGEPGPA
jgi:hypothetical protein